MCFAEHHLCRGHLKFAMCVGVCTQHKQNSRNYITHMCTKVGWVRTIANSMRLLRRHILCTLHVCTGWPQKGSHYQESALYRIKNRQWGSIFHQFWLQMSRRILYVCVKYSVCDVISGVISCCVWRCDIAKINVYNKVVIEKPDKEKIWKPNNF